MKYKDKVEKMRELLINDDRVIECLMKSNCEDKLKNNFSKYNFIFKNDRERKKGFLVVHLWGNNIPRKRPFVMSKVLSVEIPMDFAEKCLVLGYLQC